MALMDTYGLSKAQLATVLNVSRPTLNEWLSQSVENQGNRDRLAAIEQLLFDNVPQELSSYLGAFLRRKLDKESAALFSILAATDLDQVKVTEAFHAVGHALDGIQRAQHLQSLLGDNRTPPFI